MSKDLSTEKAAAAVFDERMTSGATTADVMSKGARVAPEWALLFAGEHINQVGSIYDRLKRETLSPPARSLAAMQTAFTDAQSKVFLEEVVPNVLPLGVTFQEFKRDPSKIANHQSIQRKLNQARDGCDFLLAGFDDRGLPHVVLLQANQAPVNCDRKRADRRCRPGYGRRCPSGTVPGRLRSRDLAHLGYEAG